jgi:hypothetical protein
LSVVGIFVNSFWLDWHLQIWKNGPKEDHRRQRLLLPLSHLESFLSSLEGVHKVENGAAADGGQG